MAFLRLVLTLGSLLFVSSNAGSGTVTEFTDRPAFDAATGGDFTIDTFGTTFGGPFSELSALTDLDTGDLSFGGPILPGTVAVGATYSSPTDVSTHPNGPMSLDTSTVYGAVFLHAIHDPTADSPISITATFDSLVSGFGFDSTAYLMGTGFTIEVRFETGPNYVENIGFVNIGEQQLEFFGFLSDATDILSVTIQGTGPIGASSLVAGRTNFDDFTYGVVPAAGRFNDVPTDYWAFAFIETLADNGITAGCGNNNYCPFNAVTRAEMAVFLLRARHGGDYVPPPASGEVFVDVPVSYWGAPWIEQLAAEGITGGCGSTNYCPFRNVTRAEMAVFLLRAVHGSDYMPPAASGAVFLDVPAGFWGASWIEQLKAEGITGGCGNNNYCPFREVTRAEMAVFLVRTFGL